jgi:hypothetical protein
MSPFYLKKCDITTQVTPTMASLTSLTRLPKKAGPLMFDRIIKLHRGYRDSRTGANKVELSLPHHDLDLSQFLYALELLVLILICFSHRYCR